MRRTLRRSMSARLGGRRGLWNQMSDCVTFVSKLVECRCDGLPGKRWGGCLHDFHHILKYRQILAKIQILSLARLAELLVGLRFNSADSFCGLPFLVMRFQNPAWLSDFPLEKWLRAVRARDYRLHALRDPAQHSSQHCVQHTVTNMPSIKNVHSSCDVWIGTNQGYNLWGASSRVQI